MAIGYINRKIFSFLLPYLMLFVVFLSVSSCRDQGCIEADDFGEYQSKTLIVKSSSSLDSCSYDTVHREDLTHDSHGSGLSTCFTSSNITIYDASSTAHTSTNGCQKWQPLDSSGNANTDANLPVMNLCVSQCVNECNAALMSGSSNPEPSWVSTDKREEGGGEVTLKAGAEISVRATGSVTLGGEQGLADLYVHPNVTSFFPSSFDATGAEIYQRMNSGDVIGVKFSGGFADGDYLLGSTSSTVGGVGLRNVGGRSSLNDYFTANAGKRADLMNLMNRTIMFVEQKPNGYSYSGASGEAYDRSLVSGIPMDIHPEAWSCTYTGTSIYENVCQNDISVYQSHYTGLGSTADVTAAINNKYPISSSTREGTDFSKNGGILKIDADHATYQEHSAYDPFNTSSCSAQYDCTGTSALQGIMVGDLSTNQIHPSSATGRLYFRYLDAGSACDSDINLKIRPSTSSSTDLYIHDDLTVTNSWTGGGQHVSIQQGQAFEVERVADSSATTTFDPGSGAIDCGRALAIKFVPYFDFPVNRSGLVSFKNLGSTSSTGSCTLSFRIINPTGDHSGYSFPTSLVTAYSTGTLTSIDPDFYEYGDFNATAVPEETATIKAVDNAWNTAIGDKIYVRKGQVIRFAPESWSGTWTPAGDPRKCGVGMAVRIEPRLALLCRGQGNMNIRNNACTTNIVNGEVRGCQAVSSVCNDSSGSAFCPDTTNCVGAIAYTNPSDEVSPRTGGTVTRMVYPTAGDAMQNHACGFVYDTSTTGGVTTRSALNAAKDAQCDACQDAMAAAGLQNPYVSESNVQYCYNLENYTGKVENITSEFNKFFDTLPAPSVSHANITKGIARIARFDGSYGHLGRYGNASDAESLIPTFMNHYFSRNGRLQVMILDGSDFKPTTLANSYTNNGASVVPVTYDSSSHNNGIRIKLSSFLEFGNGENLEVLFCKETSTTSNVCRSLSRRSITPAANSDGTTPSSLANVPDLNDFAPSINNSFKFDEHGNLYRSSAPRAGKKNCDGVTAGDKYFCHCRGDFAAGDEPQGCTGASSDNDNSSCGSVDGCLYRLAFKIRDVENATCAVPRSTNDPATTYDDTISYTCDNDPSTATPACNGIKGLNTSYTTTPSSNTGAICTYADLHPGGGGASTCEKQYICNSKYSNNTGGYNVVVRVKNRNNRVSGLVSSLIEPVMRVMDGYVNHTGARVPGQAERLYKLIIADPAYILILRVALVMMVSFYGLTFLMGLNDAGTSDIISKVVRIGLVLFFVSEQGWDWFYNFVVATFKHGTDELTFLVATSFDDTPALRDAIANNDYTDKSILFSSVDKVMGLFFASAVQKKISALLFSGLFGWLYILIIYYAFIAYIFAVSTAVLVYLTAQVFISILFVLGPIFFVFTLFEKTKEMFDKWLQQLIGFSLQQVFLLITLSFFNMMMYEIIKNSLGYKVCWDEVWTINIIIRISLMSFWTIPNIPPLFDSQAEMGSSGRGEGVPSFFSILFIWMVAKLMDEFITFMSSVAADIGGGISAASLAGGIMSDVKSARAMVSKHVAKPIYNRTIGHGIKRLDQKLFDSGMYADRARKAKRQQDSMDLKNKRAMVKAGRQGVDEFKKKHGAELAGLSKEEQQKRINQARDDAMAKKGKKMGLSESEIKRLKEDKGVKYRGDNLVGYAAKAAFQKARRGGSVSKSITSKDASTDFSKKQAKKALKNADKEGRDKMMKSVEKGEMYVKAGRLRKRLSAKVKGPQILESADHKKARQQLEDEGKISKMRAGVLSGALRKSDENKMIRERMKSNQLKEGEGKMNKRSRASTVASLQMEKEYQDVKQGDVTDKESVDKQIIKGPMGMELKRRGKFSDHKDKKEAIKAGRLKSMRAEVTEKKEKLGNEISQKQDQIDNVDAQIQDLMQDEGVAKHEELKKEYDNVKGWKPSAVRQRAAIAENMARVAADKGTKAKIAALNDKRSEKNKLSGEKATIESAEQNLAATDQTLSDMETIQSGADHILEKNNDGSYKNDYSDEERNSAVQAQRGLEKIKKGHIGAESGYSKSGVVKAGAVVAGRMALKTALSPISAVATAVQSARKGKFTPVHVTDAVTAIRRAQGRERSDKVTSSGFGGMRKKGTKESVEYMKEAFKDVHAAGSKVQKDDQAPDGNNASAMRADMTQSAPKMPVAGGGGGDDDGAGSGGGDNGDNGDNGQGGGSPPPRPPRPSPPRRTPSDAGAGGGANLAGTTEGDSDV